ncbi:hypothetical protein PTSG_08583 [Salpingoeca rosetta]|uniref:Atg6 BARA domain-containing protein n=1 Tax=Salpingoeca rosetta (strain ATCC 50818 / BSB-021) TaxID=946362 RepID=F2UK37_SALR5|nr:uncharacterized protein PTSG_08583 [Salpingoeca rosetta]EGD77486.1 hypothetical protein PTSG_08583 [Salpingoeca rosetta]|eukprot:XP_004990374.1 hypothetical protein PTSG_08583 [Salpingoeca rosetta]
MTSTSATTPQTTMVGFCCQACRAPLKLDADFSDVTAGRRETFARELSSVKAPAEPTVGDADDENFTDIVDDKYVRPNFGNLDDNSSQNTKEQQNQSAMALFDFLSSRTNLDHPLCQACTDSLLDQLDDELQHAHKEKQDYEALWDELSSLKVTTSVEEIEAEIAELEKQEKEALAEIEEQEKQRAEIAQMKAAQEAELKVLEEEEEKYWREYNDYQRQLIEFEERQDSVEHQYHQASQHLEALKKTNVFNDTFHIWYDSHFGTINGFRLGRLPSVPVSWGEVNAGWGHTVLLLYIMAQRLGITFKGRQLLPNGSSSRIRVERSDTEPAEDLPLFGSGSRFFSDPKFDSGMKHFLECVRQFKDNVDSHDPHFKLPYAVNADGTISDGKQNLSICMQNNTEENWTKALKFMLTNLKWCLAWMCKQMAS